MIWLNESSNQVVTTW